MRSLSLTVALVLAATAPAFAGGPTLQAKAAIVLDDAGNVVFEQDADEERAIGSMTKIFVALAVRRAGLDPGDWSTIEKDDVIASAGGSKSRLPKGSTWKNVDLLRAMLMVSDNRAPTALGRSVGLDRKALIAEMNAVAADLGLTHTTFYDTTGIAGNVSTARELAIALTRTLEDPVLAKIMRTRTRRIVSKNKKVKVDYRSTVIPLHMSAYKLKGGKTGHTSAAGYCMMLGAYIAGGTYVMAFLGGPKKEDRMVDFDAVAKWLEKSAKKAKKKKQKKGATATR
jgi:D-alanyl-D-alanine endopeptidase (penicillin-binding protein 7)